MKRHLSSTEYEEVRLLVDRILTVSDKETAEEYLNAFDALRSKGGFVGSAGSILSELYSFLKTTPMKSATQDPLSMFAFVDSYLVLLKNYVRNS